MSMYSILITLWLLLFPVASFASEPPTVNYSYAGKTMSFIGSRTPHGYLYNPDGEQTVELATLDWPPYIGEQLCNKGWSFHLAVAVLTSQNYRLIIRFMPWPRAVHQVEAGRMDILYPEYEISETTRSEHLTDRFRLSLLALSDPFPGGEVVLMKRRGSFTHFTGELEQLRGLKIGVVRGYQNTPEFDAMMERGEFTAVEAVNDLQLMKLLDAGRVDLVVGDPKVLRHRVIHSSLSQADKQRILQTTAQVNPALRYNRLHFSVSRKNANWPELLQRINTALETLNRSGELDRLIADNSSCR
ncbi:substrate-binding periplasmic protein [Neptuniibacter halophilus]|uniref:substrate-binding periplasmic protein n=1 Tax=Neptuniibacter halophilus TaxID=651666 RepID=UPI002573C059|nr:transporter substrate-binding domain-containing protein [Neptuniibacter halophilus]